MRIVYECVIFVFSNSATNITFEKKWNCLQMLAFSGIIIVVIISVPLLLLIVLYSEIQM
jgi:hypothetical protein